MLHLTRHSQTTDKKGGVRKTKERLNLTSSLRMILKTLA